MAWKEFVIQNKNFSAERLARTPSTRIFRNLSLCESAVSTIACPRKALPMQVLFDANFGRC
jgi:hypothetical protein